MVGMSNWNDVLFTFNFDIDYFKLRDTWAFSKVTKDLDIFNIMPLMGMHLRTPHFSYKHYYWTSMAGVFSWNEELNMLCTFNFDLDLRMSLFQGYKRLDLFNNLSFTGTTSFSAYFIETSQLILDNGRIVQLEWCRSILNFDLCLKLTLSQGHKDVNFSTSCCSGLALAGRQVADGYYSYHPAINIFLL